MQEAQSENLVPLTEAGCIAAAEVERIRLSPNPYTCSLRTLSRQLAKKHPGEGREEILVYRSHHGQLAVVDSSLRKVIRLANEESDVIH